jgi:hypothetical protein
MAAMWSQWLEVGASREGVDRVGYCISQAGIIARSVKAEWARCIREEKRQNGPAAIKILDRI